ncbi:4Fe-4S cluster-binding domain-containing protein [Suttonella ornithocola]|uniref:Anaerobic ribonucleoside-triphosphate reductase activating protein n=1 Tax=Suttonella ornithocola TaxID=279832 RepID=A0A380MYB7_9GAMM|nr:4Fe-4S cluster-binding domain-containing protein [Suttonella ornithocola]SUO97570.1 anaerobic ribonucleoside-triphosphate reductase activating protein [Suttonella ornithocola]
MDILYAAEERVVWQEVPDEVSLAFLISGCPLKCRGCHSAYARCPFIGQPLTQDYLEKRLLDYQGLLSCVLFLGGEWQLTALLACLMLVRSHGLKTCLYTGLDDIDARLMAQLT